MFFTGHRVVEAHQALGLVAVGAAMRRPGRDTDDAEREEWS